jgi:hypothetical protein
MIQQLYIFSVGNYVVAQEWNDNFRAINQSNVQCAYTIQQAYQKLAFVDGDLTDLFNAVMARFNSFAIPGNSVVVAPECEYYKDLQNGSDLNITIPLNMNGESRIAIKIHDNRALLPFTVGYSGNLKISNSGHSNFSAGNYFIVINEIQGNAIVKLIWTGV